MPSTYGPLAVGLLIKELGYSQFVIVAVVVVDVVVVAVVVVAAVSGRNCTIA